MFFCFWEPKLFFKIQFPNTIFFKKTPKTVLKNCSKKLFSRTVFKNSNQTSPTFFFLEKQKNYFSEVFLFFFMKTQVKILVLWEKSGSCIHSSILETKKLVSETTNHDSWVFQKVIQKPYFSSLIIIFL